MDLNNLTPVPGSIQRRRRVGRGIGSGNGKTAGRGQKGQLSRSGARIPATFEGGQMPLHRRLPKRGFTNSLALVGASVNVGELEVFAAGSVVDREALVRAGLVKGRVDFVKVLGGGEIKVALTVKVERFSASARQKIEGAGGLAEVLGA
jgi:large subunit ribosomal protein L15